MLNRGAAFQSRAWQEAGFNHILLRRVFRQAGGEFLGAASSGVRVGSRKR